MNIKLLDILVCPQCKGRLTQVESGQSFLCNQCHLKYPVRDGIPVMLLEEALDMKSGLLEETQMLSAKQMPSPPKPRAAGGKTVVFEVTDGPDTGLRFDLSLGTCRAMGRAVRDPNKTNILNVDWALSLDEETKGLVLQYISQQFRRPSTSTSTSKPQASGASLGSFRRSQDLILKDQTLSRLHAMIFYDTVGVGILDLVSKNGTFVNGEEVESRLLKEGDTIELGETKISFVG